MTLVSGSGWEVGGTSWSATSETRATAPMMSSSWPAKWSSSSGFSSRRASRCEVGDLLARDARHAAILRGECVDFGPILWGGAPHPLNGLPRRRRPGPPTCRGGAAGEGAQVTIWPDGWSDGWSDAWPDGDGGRAARAAPAVLAAGAEPRRGLGGRHGGGHQPSLHRVAAEVPQALPRLVVLDALRDDEEAQECARSTVQRTISASSLSTASRATNERSIFSSLTGSRRRCTSEE